MIGAMSGISWCARLRIRDAIWCRDAGTGCVGSQQPNKPEDGWVSIPSPCGFIFSSIIIMVSIVLKFSLRLFCKLLFHLICSRLHTRMFSIIDSFFEVVIESIFNIPVSFRRCKDIFLNPFIELS